MSVTLKDVVKRMCDQYGLDFDEIEEVELDHPEHPSKVTVWFEDNPDPLTIEINPPAVHEPPETLQ